MTRVDLYTAVHKALRAELFQIAVAVARADFSEQHEALRISERLRALLSFLEEHAQHEDEVLLPEIAQFAPQLHAELSADHAQDRALEHELHCTLDRLDTASRVERSYIGKRIHERLGRLIAAHCRHMDIEETQVNALLWEQRSDEQLNELEGRIIEMVSPQRLAQWMVLFARGVSTPELAPMFAGMQAHMSAQDYAEVVAPARADLGEVAWARLELAIAAAAQPAIPVQR
jgi:hypothetical protein